MTQSTDAPNWMQRVTALARQKVGMPDWQLAVITAVDHGGILIEGYVCPPITRGPRTGGPNWRKGDKTTKRTIYLSDDEVGP